jgi:hypothetical protein
LLDEAVKEYRKKPYGEDETPVEILVADHLMEVYPRPTPKP